MVPFAMGDVEVVMVISKRIMWGWSEVFCGFDCIKYDEAKRARKIETSKRGSCKLQWYANLILCTGLKQWISTGLNFTYVLILTTNIFYAVNVRYVDGHETDLVFNLGQIVFRHATITFDVSHLDRNLNRVGLFAWECQYKRGRYSEMDKVGVV